MYAEMPLNKYITFWMQTFKQKSVKPATYSRLKTSAKALSQFSIAKKKLQDITAFDVQNYVNELTDYGYGMTTIKKQLCIVTAPLKQAAALHFISADPTVGVALPTPNRVLKEKRETRPYSNEEQSLLWQAILDSDKPAWLCLGFMIETGLRVGEALALEWQNIDIARRKLRVEATILNLADGQRSTYQASPKTISSKRTVPLTAQALTLLDKLKKLSQGRWVFEGRNGERLSYEALRYQTKKACEQAGIPYLGEHVFRHTFATNCYYKGMDVKVLSKLLGHADVNITYNIYISLQDDGFNDMYRALCS